MNKFFYTSKYINTLSLIIAIIIFGIINIFYTNINIFIQKASLKVGFNVNQELEKLDQNNLTSFNIQENNTNISEISKKSDWYIEIPSIELKAEIKEGTTKENLENFVGHFEETEKIYGNVGLAAHNRGYKNNYFENIKKLKEGDLIIYCYQNNIKEYVVTNQNIIKDTDWSYLEKTKENILTLITCVENEPSYRRCIQAIEKVK